MLLLMEIGLSFLTFGKTINYLFISLLIFIILYKLEKLQKKKIKILKLDDCVGSQSQFKINNL